MFVGHAEMMHVPIQLDVKFNLRTIEVKNIRSYTMLSSEF